MASPKKRGAHGSGGAPGEAAGESSCDSVPSASGEMGTMNGGCHIGRLPDEVLWSIIALHVDDDRTLGACLLAWRRFHVLGAQDMQKRKYRCATAMSVCAAGDADGLRFVLDHADVCMPAGRFRWDSCLFVAAAAGNVAVTDMIKQAIQAGGAYGSWPVAPLLWWSLAFVAAQRDRSAMLEWLCLPDNATSSQPALSIEEKSTYAMVSYTLVMSLLTPLPLPALEGRLASFLDTTNPISSIFLIPLDPGIARCVRTIVRDLAPDGHDSICDRVSHFVCGLDAREAFGSKLFIKPAAATTPNVDDAHPPDDIGFDERLRQEIETDDDDDRRSIMIWKAVERGLLRDMETGIGREALVRRMRGTSVVAAVKTAIESGHHEDALWIYDALCESKGHQDPLALQPLASGLACAGRVDLLEKIQYGPWGFPVGSFLLAPVNEPAFWMAIIRGAAEGGHVHILESLRNHPTDKKDSGPVEAAIKNDHIDAAAWLCAHGYSRTCADKSGGGQTLLYRALCECRFDIVRILLDPAASEGALCERVDGLIADSVAAAVRDALTAGNLTVTTWLREHHRDAVDRTVAHLRADLWPMCDCALDAIEFMDTMTTLLDP